MPSAFNRLTVFTFLILDKLMRLVACKKALLRARFGPPGASVLYKNDVSALPARLNNTPANALVLEKTRADVASADMPMSRALDCE
jgi:hypothetical protein